MSTLPNDPVSRSHLLADLASGLNPIVETQPDYTAKPGVESGGADVRNATIAVVDVAVREHPLRRTCRYRLTRSTVDLTSASYAIAVDGVSATVTGTWATVDALLEALRDEVDAIHGIGGSGKVSATVEASADDGILDTVKIEGVGEADFDFDGTAPGGVTLSLSGDASSCRVRVLGRAKDLGAGSTARRRGWRLLVDPETGLPADYAVDRHGVIQSFPCGWLASVHPYMTEAVGPAGDGSGVSHVATVYVRPCVSIGSIA